MGPRRTWMIVVGIIALVLAVPILIGGAALAAIFGTDGRFESGDEQIETSTRGLVSAVADISADAPIDRGDIALELELLSASEKPLFVGVGPAADVTAYLAGVNVERVDDFDFAPFRYRKTELPGERVPDPPGDQTFWVAQVEGSGEQRLSWDLRSGTYQVVVMNADGSPVVDVTGSIGVSISWIFPLAVGLLIVGALLLAAGILLIVFGAKRRPLPAGTAGRDRLLALPGPAGLDAARRRRAAAALEPAAGGPDPPRVPPKLEPGSPLPPPSPPA